MNWLHHQLRSVNVNLNGSSLAANVYGCQVLFGDPRLAASFSSFSQANLKKMRETYLFIVIN